jgi:hypothetical protein
MIFDFNQSTDDEMSLSVVEMDGEPLWQACGGGHCVRHRCGSTAQALLRQVRQGSPNQSLGSGSSVVTSSSGNS